MNDQLSGLTPAHRDILRIAGSVLLAAGVFALLIRKGEDWSDFPILLVLGIPCALFYGLGIGALRLGPGDDVRDDVAVRDPAADRVGVADRVALPAWRAVCLVLGIIFVAFTLEQLVQTIGGDPDKSGWVFIIFLATAAAAAYAAFVHGLRYGALLAGLALIVSWIALWDAIVDPSATAIRWLFLIIGAGLAVAALRLHGDDRREAPELVTAAGIAGLAAGVTALFVLGGALVGGAFASAFGAEPDLAGGSQQGDEWNVFLLILAVALIWYGARAPWRGPAYVGTIALIVFIVAVGTDVAALFDGDEPGDGVIGWPLLLLALGGAALAAGLLGGSGRRAAPEAAPTQPMTTKPVPPPPSGMPPASQPPQGPPPQGPPGA
jgi:hypothetical protein